MKIGILQTGRSPETLQKNFGDYNDLFMKLFKQQDFEFTTYAVIDSIFPKTPTEMDAWLITGSRHGAYEKLSWIPPLENFIRSAYKTKIPIVAICFGHQILAQALGGKVEKFKGGMKCGVEKLKFKGSTGSKSFDPILNCKNLSFVYNSVFLCNKKLQKFKN